MDTLALVDEKISENADLYKRMDATEKLLHGEKFVLKKFDGNTPIDKAISVTPNIAQTFTLSIVEKLIGGIWQTVAEGEISARQERIIEQFADDNLRQADDGLQQKFGIPGLFDFLANHVCARGYVGARWLAGIDKQGKYSVDCIPLDMRWTPYEFGKNGLKDGWICPLTYRSQADIESEYPETKGKLSGKGPFEVRDYWNDKLNEVWIQGKKFFEQENTLRYPPFVVAIAPVGFMMRTKGYQKYEGEDILFLIRNLWEEFARQLSIESTLGMDILYPPYEQEVESMDAEAAQEPPKSGQTIKVKKGERHIPLPRGDMNNASMTARQDIQRMMDEGATKSPRAYTTPPSAVELYGEEELLGKLMNSRVKTLQIFREQIIKMAIDQYIRLAKTKGELSVGTTGRRHTYAPDKLGDPDKYSISCKLMPENKRMMVAKIAMAGAARGIMPLKIILRDILQSDDPEGIERELQIEQARQADPAIGLFEMALRYVDEAAEEEDEQEADAKKIQSMMLTERGVSIIRSRMAPPIPEQPPVSQQSREPTVEQPKSNMQGLLSLPGLMGGSKSGVNGNKQTQEEVV